MEGANVEIWQCDAAGNYSQYGSQTAQTYLRGIQTTNANGEVTFTTIYPGWYQGRATHIHVEVTRNGASAKVTQIAFPESVNATVYATRRLCVAGLESDVQYAGRHLRGQPRLRAGDGQRRSDRRIYRDVHRRHHGVSGPARRVLPRPCALNPFVAPRVARELGSTTRRPESRSTTGPRSGVAPLYPLLAKRLAFDRARQSAGQAASLGVPIHPIDGFVRFVFEYIKRVGGRCV